MNENPEVAEECRESEAAEPISDTEYVIRRYLIPLNILLTLCLLYIRTWIFIYEGMNSLDLNLFRAFRLMHVSCFSGNPWIYIGCLILNLAIIFVFTSLGLRIIWNKLFSSLFGLRKISYAESYSVFIGILLVFSIPRFIL